MVFRWIPLIFDLCPVSPKCASTLRFPSVFPYLIIFHGGCLFVLLKLGGSRRLGWSATICPELTDPVHIDRFSGLQVPRTPFLANFRVADTRELIGPVNTTAFIGTNPTGELITSGLPVIQAQSQADKADYILTD